MRLRVCAYPCSAQDFLQVLSMVSAVVALIRVVPVRVPVGITMSVRV
jgi:hypothetical protein